MPAGSTFDRTCPTCRERFEVQGSQFGDLIECPHCGVEVRASEKPAAETQPPRMERIKRAARKVGYRSMREARAGKREKQRQSQTAGLSKCRTCGHQVARDAKSCPSCGEGNPDTGLHRTNQTIAAVVAIVVIGVPLVSCSGLIALFAFSDSSGSKLGWEVELDAIVSFTGTQFTIRNDDSFDWTDITLELNSGLVSSGYSLSIPTIEAGATYSVGAMQFTDSSGERFNPFTHKAQNMWIKCNTSQGRGTQLLGWD